VSEQTRVLAFADLASAGRALHETYAVLTPLPGTDWSPGADVEMLADGPLTASFGAPREPRRSSR